MIAVLAWWVWSSLLGVAAFPAAYRVFHKLPDRGYGLSRALGLLLAGYLLWIGASVGILHNSLGGALAACVVVVGFGLWAVRGRWEEVRRWLADHLRSVLVMELIFLACFGLWCFVRANNPDITATEKPMELAFLNVILRSESFPPSDPWLSGYAISYYYFGYVLLAFMARLTGVTAGLAFNLGNALWFGMTALGTYSLAYNLLASREGRPRLLASLLGPVFVLFSGNLEGLFEVAYARHLFWRTQPDGTLTFCLAGDRFCFWKWLGLPDLQVPPTLPASWMPNRFWSWWQASRVVNDVDLAGRAVGAGPIDEFPLFSFLLADNHPHLLALPFVLVAISMALQVYLLGRRGELRLGRSPIGREQLRWLAGGAALVLLLGVGSRVAGAVMAHVSAREAVTLLLKSSLIWALLLAFVGAFLMLVLGVFPSALSAQEFWFSAWMFGSLAFLNAWDFPIYLSMLVAVVWWTSRGAAAADILKRLLGTAVGLGVAGVLFYLPWYPGFASQAGGILPNLAFPTRFSQFLIMFGTMFVPLLAWLVWKAVKGWQPSEWRPFIMLALALPIGLLVLSWLLGGILMRLRPDLVSEALGSLGAPSLASGISAVLKRRIWTSWTALLLGMMFSLSVLLIRRKGTQPGDTPGKGVGMVPFVAILAGIGTLLVIGPEFLYLKDLFLVRMNTVFKFYFAAWLLWGMAAAYAAAELWPPEANSAGALRSLLLVPLLLGYFYTVTATWTKAVGFNPPTGQTLDGTAHLERDNPDDYAAILWMNDNLSGGVIAEAVGGSYTGFARVSAHTGLSTVIGWPGHEVQWRGDAHLLGSREEDIRRLYETRDWGEAQAILAQYGIDYVYVGSLERQAYHPLSDGKFQAFMDVIYQAGEVTIYARRGGV